MSPADTRTLHGRPASDGVAIGTAVYLRSRALEELRFPVAADAIESELERLRAAVRETRDELRRTQAKVAARVGADVAGIFEAHGLMLEDPLFLGRIEARVRSDRINAEWAVHETAEELGQQFAKIESEHLRGRGEDLRDVARYLQKALQGISHHELSEIAGDVVVIADELTPSDTLRLGRQKVAGLALEGGGINSHTAIVARAFQIPLVTGLGPLGELIDDDDRVIVDGTAGIAVLHPSPAVLEEYRGKRQREHAAERAMVAAGGLPAITRDGVSVTLMANLEIPEELDDALRFGADGIGLYRSEFLYIEKSPQLPTEDDHFRVYRRLVEAMAPRPVVIRTLDLGGRKLAREVLETREDNSNLGLRGIRLTLCRPAIFRTQLRALLRASVYGNLRIMVPLLSGLDEALLFRAFYRDVLDELEVEGVRHDAAIPVGAMIEVPSAALIADRLALEFDFLAIGTNDLIQYTLAVDRSNEHVAGLYQPLHPAILQLLLRVVEAGQRLDVEVSLCGEMASRPLFMPLLLGAGLRRFSMAPRSLAAVNARIRTLTITRCEEILQECTKISRPHDIELILRRELLREATSASAPVLTT